MISITWILSKLTSLPFILSALIIFLSLPILSQTIIDTGPISLHFFLALFIPYLLRNKVEKKEGLIVGLLLFLGIQQKAFFIISIPAILIISVLFIDKLKVNKRELALFCITSLITFIVPCLILFTAKTPEGPTYWSTLSKLSEQIPFLILPRHFPRAS